MEANLKDIKWLLENVTQYKISKEIGVSQPMVSLLKNGKRQIGKISFELACELTEYSRKVQSTKESERAKSNE